MQDQPGHKQELTQLESSGDLECWLAAPRVPQVCVPDLTLMGEPQVKRVLCSESLKHSRACSACLPLLGGAVYPTTSPASAKQMGKVTVFMEKTEL